MSIFSSHKDYCSGFIMVENPTKAHLSKILSYINILKIRKLKSVGGGRSTIAVEVITVEAIAVEAIAV